MPDEQETPDPHLFPPQDPPSTTASEFIGCAISTAMLTMGTAIVGLAALAPFYLVYLVFRAAYRLFN